MQPLITCVVAGIQYLIHPQVLGTIEETINPDAIVPVTLLDSWQIDHNVDELLSLYDWADDVFIPDFGFYIVEKPSENSTDWTGLESSRNVESIYHLVSSEVAVEDSEDLYVLPSGPYFLRGPNLHQAWRLYEDTLDVFSVGVIPEDVKKPEKYLPVTTLSQSGLSKAIPVPSRLYLPPPPETPLSTTRVTISDALSLQGVSTTLSSKAWAELHPEPDNATAAYVQKLMEMGAVIVGKTKTSQFSAGREWVDVPLPWVPRGDGYHRPASGPAAGVTALAGYEWLDVAVAESNGFDGVVQAAIEHGMYAVELAPSSSLLDGVHLDSPFSSLGIAHRTLDELLRIASRPSGVPTHEIELLAQIKYITDFDELMTPELAGLMQPLLETVEDQLSALTEPVSLADTWSSTPPAEAQGQELQEFMKEAPFGVYCYEFYHGYESFRGQYEKMTGSPPFVEATVAFQWEHGKNISEEEYKNHKEKIAFFQTWFREHIMPSDSNTLIVLPYRDHKPLLRNENLPKPEARHGIQPAFLASLLDAGQVVTPFAQTPYESRISQRIEHRPLAGVFLTNAGKEFSLIKSVKSGFELAGWRTRVDTGRRVFPLSDNPRNVEDPRPFVAASGSDLEGTTGQSMLKEEKAERKEGLSMGDEL